VARAAACSGRRGSIRVACNGPPPCPPRRRAGVGASSRRSSPLPSWPSARRRSRSCSPALADARGCGRRSTCSTSRRRPTFEQQLELEATTQAELTQNVRFRRRPWRHSSRSASRAFTGAAVVRPHPIHLVVTDDLKAVAADGRAALVARAAATGSLAGRVDVCCASRSRLVNWFHHARPRPAVRRGCTAWTSRFIRLPGARQRVHLSRCRSLTRRSAGWARAVPDRPCDRPCDRAGALEGRCCESSSFIPAYVFMTVAELCAVHRGERRRVLCARRPGRYPRGFSRDFSGVLPALPGTDVRLPASC